MMRLQQEMHPLLTPSVLVALSAKNIRTISSFLDGDVKQIAILTNLAHKDILTIRKHLINKHAAITRNGLTYYNELLQKTAILPTRISSLDELLNGGLTTGNIYEVCGLPASGKTQFCLTLIKNLVQHLNQPAYYMDTKRDFSAKRILNMLEDEKHSENQIAAVMSQILVKRTYTMFELINSLYEVLAQMQSGFKTRLIVVDSLPALFYQLDDKTNKYGVMNNLVNVMHLLAKEYHIVFVVANTVTTWYEGDFGSEKNLVEKLGMGKYWLTVPNVRLIVKETEVPSKLEFRILKSSVSAKGRSCTVNLGNTGIF